MLLPTSILAFETEQQITLGEALRLGCVFQSDERYMRRRYDENDDEADVVLASTSKALTLTLTLTKH